MADPNEQQARIRADFTRTAEAAQELLDLIERNIQAAEAIGNEEELVRLRAQKAAVGGYKPQETSTINESTAALERQNQVLQEGLQKQLQTLDLLRAEADLRKRVAQESLIVPNVPQRYSSYEQTAGGQVAAEEARAAAARAAEAEALATREAFLSSLRPPGTRFGQGYESLAGPTSTAEQAEAERQRADAAARELAAQRAITQELEHQAYMQQAYMRNARAAGYQVGAGFASYGPGERQGIIGGPQGASAAEMGGAFTAAQQAEARFQVALGEYEGYATRAGLATNALTADLTRLGMVQAEESNAMREHGALTTEWLTALARGETTVSEFGYQIGATVGKFAGWTAAATATYAAIGAMAEFGKGAIDGSNAVDQLKRTIDNLDTQKAAQDLRDLSQGTDVSMKEAGDAVFQFSRTFHNLGDATTAAHLGLAALQLDNVQLSDSVRLATSLSQQWGLGMHGLVGIYDMLAAGQREYNARLSDMIPLLQTASGAVHGAGGSLDQLVQLATVSSRLTQLGGSRIGTAFYRSASNFTRQNASALANQFGLQADINPLTGQGNWTQLLMDAIRRSVDLTPGQRTQLAVDIFGKQFGGRMQALFSPQGAALLNEVTGASSAGGGRGPLTPDATRGKLNQELGIQLAQTTKQLDQLVNGLQRMGSALASSGALFPLGVALHAAVMGLNALAAPLELFSQLPGWAKDATSTLLELRVAMLFFSRTRFGSTTPGITRLPGFRPSEATLARGELAIGTRTAMESVQADLARTTSRQLANGAQLAAMGQQRAALEAEIGSADEASAAQLERSNAISARMVDLQAQQTRLELERTDQLAALQALQQQQIGLTAINRNRRWTDDQVLALQSAAGVGTEAEQAATAGASSVGLGAAMSSRLSAAKARMAALLRRDAAATAELAAAETEVADAAAAEIAATEAASVEGAAQVGLMAAARTSLSTWGARLAGLAGALDPLTVGLVALPFVIGGVDSALKQSSDAARSAANALAEPAGNLTNLAEQIRRLGAAANKQASSQWHLPGFLSDAENLALNAMGDPHPFDPLSAIQRGIGASPGDPGQTRALQTSARALLGHYESYIASIKQEGPALVRTEAGRRRLAQVMDDMTRAAQAGAAVTFQGHPEAMAHAIKDFENALQAQYQEIVTAALSLRSGVHGTEAQVFSTVASVAPATMKSYLQSLDDFSKVFGTQNTSLRQAAQYYAALTDKYRTSTGDDAAMQALSAAQQNFVNAVNKNVQDLLHAASVAPSTGAAMGDLQSAIGTLNNERNQVSTAFGQAIEYARQTGQSAHSIQLLQDAEQQLLNQLMDLHQQVIQQILDTVKSEAAVATSSIRGISPEADIARAASTLAGLQQQLAAARANGAQASTVNDLVAQVNDAQNTLIKDRIDNARNIVQAQGQLAQSAITGISPQDDIARAQVAVQRARALLAFDQANGAGQATILQDQASLFQAQYQLNQQIQQRDAQIESDAKAMIDAQAAYAESQTTNPVQQARDALAAAQRALTVIRPQDYKTYQEYQTAILNQKAAAGKAVQDLRQAIVQQDERTLKFELDTLRITDQQYINGLQQLLKMRHLSLQDRQQIMQDIFDVTQQTAVNLNTGNIKMPTTYEVKSAIRNAMRGRRAAAADTGAAVVQNNSMSTTVNLYVSKDADIAKVAKVLDAHANTTAQAAAQAAGLI